MRIAVFTDTFLPSINGVVTAIVNSTRGLAAKRHQIIIFTSSGTGSEKINLGHGITIKYYKTTNLIKYPDFKLAVPSVRIINEMSKFKPDVIHSHMPSFLGWEAVICSKMFHTPLIGTYHTLLPDFMGHTRLPRYMSESEAAKRIVWGYTRGYYNLCDQVITPSKAMKDVLVKEGIKKPIRAMSNGVDLKRFKPANRNEKISGVRKIIHVGRISYEKDIETVIKAYKIAMKEEPDWKLRIVGGGPDLKRLKKVAGRLLHKKIEFSGPINHNKLSKIYSRADVFVTASTIETEGLVILEAMACGLPVVGVDKLAIPNIVKHEKTGFIAKAHDEKEMASYLLKLMRSRKLRQQMGRRGALEVSKYSIDKTIETLEKIYKEARRNKRRKKEDKKRYSHKKA
ncbi:glycosyltransferase [Candidatus Woesearchaeota archaeon]|nr:glycosyltransferase [Candidatus Woesearchaeota archaeon]